MTEQLTIRQASERCGMRVAALRRVVDRGAVPSTMIDTLTGPVRMVAESDVRTYLAQRPAIYQDRGSARDGALSIAAERLGISIKGARLAQQRGHTLIVQRAGHWQIDDDAVDAYAAQRTTQRLGSANGRARLSESDIPEIRRLHTEGWTLAAIAEVYQVARQTIHGVVIRRTWKQVE